MSNGIIFRAIVQNLLWSSSSPSSYTRWHPSFLHRCAIEKLNWINSIVHQYIQSFNRAPLRRRCLMHTSSKQYSITIGLEEAKTIPIVCACTFGIGRIGRISESFARKTVYLYKQSTIWAQNAPASCWLLDGWLKIVM